MLKLNHVKEPFQVCHLKVFDMVTLYIFGLRFNCCKEVAKLLITHFTQKLNYAKHKNQILLVIEERKQHAKCSLAKLELSEVKNP